MEKNSDLRRVRFQNIAAKRTQNVLDALDSLAKCSNKRNYNYTEVDVKKMINHIRKKVKEVDVLYVVGGGKTDKSFKF